jgi:putative integral membrane protein (TIGR02587 family)
MPGKAGPLAPGVFRGDHRTVPRTRKSRRGRTVGESFREYGRGIAGGLLFSLPLLYTMEVWFAGFLMPPHRQLAYVLAGLVLLLGYNRFAGLHPDTTWAEIAIDSIEEMGIGLLLSAAVLLLIGRLTVEQDTSEVVGRIVVEAVTVAIGVSVGTAQLGAGGDKEPGMDGREEGSLGGQLTLALCGAVLFAANVAPTEEIVQIGIELSGLQLGLLGIATMILAALVLYFSDFRGARRWARAEGRFAMFRGTVITYAVGLVASAAVLWAFGRFDGMGATAITGQTVALAVASTLGASAGRLLLQGGNDSA